MTKAEREAEIIKMAVETFGFQSQLSLLQEECGELIVAASHYRRGRERAYENLIEELADVDIMINQMIYALQADIEVAKEQKLLRLEKRIKEKKGDGTAQH